MMKPPEMLIRGHLGLGDMLLCNALYREYARTNRVTVLAKHHNVSSTAFMMRDCSNITVVGVKDDKEADDIVTMVRDNGRAVLGLGFYGKPPFDRWSFDEQLYRQANVDFQENRWNGFKVERQLDREFIVDCKRYIFVHDDFRRGIVIDPTKMPNNRKIVRSSPKPPRDERFGVDPNIFDWWSWLDKAEEIHCINSSFLILVDSLPDLKSKRIVFHQYARPDGEIPKLNKHWEVLK